MEDFMMLQVYGAARLCPQILSSTILCFGSSPSGMVTYTLVWLPLYLLSPLDVSLEVTDYGSFPQGPVGALRILLCLRHLFTHVIPQHPSVIQFFILLPAPLESSNSHAHFNSG